MLVSTPDYIAVRSTPRTRRDSSMSPSCRLHAQRINNTPPRKSTTTARYDSPMLTPSPLRKRPLFPYDSATTDTDSQADEDDDIFLQSHLQSPMSRYHRKPFPIQIDDEEFLSTQPQPSFASFTPFPTSSSQPLRTPVKQVRRTSSYLSINHLHAQPHSALVVGGGGTKRKETSSSSGDFSTPLRQGVMTPLAISSARTGEGGISFDRLAPLPAPHFTTPRQPSKVEAEVHLKKHTETMTKLRICDLDDSDEDAVVVGGGQGVGLFSNTQPSLGGGGRNAGRTVGGGGDGGGKTHSYIHAKQKSTSLGRSLGASLLAIAQTKKGTGKGNGNGKGTDEVAEAISPGGHINKRRARSRPVSQELMESFVCGIPSRESGQADVSNARSKSKGRSAVGGGRGRGPSFPFPSLTQIRTRAISNSNSPSPSSRSSLSTPSPPLPFSFENEKEIGAAPGPVRAPMSRLTSSATLFFGPAIPNANLSTRTNVNPTPNPKSKSDWSSRSPKATLAVDTSVPRSGVVHSSNRPLSNRHSYAGPESATRRSGATPLPWARGLRASPGSASGSESPSPRSGGAQTDDDDMFFDGPKDSSFIFSVTEGTPSPRRHSVGGAGLRKKYKPRDSGVVVSDDEGVSISTHTRGMRTGGTLGASGSIGGTGDWLSVMPRASTSVSSVYSDLELVTPGYGPGERSGWPDAFVVTDASEGGSGGVGGEDGVDADAFILRTLAAATKGPKDRRNSEGLLHGGRDDGFRYGMKIPGTPVKKVKTSHLGVDGVRLWQSAITAKVGGLGFDLDLGLEKGKKAPRKSMPAVVSWKERGAGVVGGGDTESEGEEDSPSFRREGLGVGRPVGSAGGKSGGAFSKSRRLMRRSSSGIFSGESDVSIGTPTKLHAEWNVSPSHIPTQFSRAKNAIKFTTGRSISGSSSSSSTTLNSPSARRQLLISGATTTPACTHTHQKAHASPIQQAPEPERQRSGRFERDFVEVDEVGSGEFGKVMKVQYKSGQDGELFAIKKSKRFEGIRHRQRLREEVNILQHLSRAAKSGAGGQHPNVLAYVDSWEQDEALYIQTELCELGNFARFLWEFGRVFPRLDEPRVWKIFVDLSDGLEFIHNSGVIHLDLKPANIFVTGGGRFKIGDFGMASLWPRPNYKAVGSFERGGAFEREGDKVYLAPEVLQGNYGKEADIFSLGITMLETASNIVVPDQVDAWHQLRQEDFSQVDLEGSPELLALIKNMMRTNPTLRIDIRTICSHPVISRARSAMQRTAAQATASGASLFTASPLASVPDAFLEEILGRLVPDDGAMDLSP